jgi:heme-degrading monooxygenase HmoA
MIERHLRGVAKIEEAEAYVAHLLNETFPKLAQIQGFVQWRILKRTIATGIEFKVITTWQSMESIKQFSGDAIDAAVVPDTVQKMMVEYDSHVSHFEVLTLCVA